MYKLGHLGKQQPGARKGVNMGIGWVEKVC